jgi:hypothetical protein
MHEQDPIGRVFDPGMTDTSLVGRSRVIFLGALGIISLDQIQPINSLQCKSDDKVWQRLSHRKRDLLFQKTSSLQLPKSIRGR